jgi:ribonuclease HI
MEEEIVKIKVDSSGTGIAVIIPGINASYQNKSPREDINISELRAILHGLNDVKEFVKPQNRKLEIISDSTTAIGWIKHYLNNKNIKLKNKFNKNKVMTTLKEINTYYTYLVSQNNEINFKYGKDTNIDSLSRVAKISSKGQKIKIK